MALAPKNVGSRGFIFSRPVGRGDPVRALCSRAAHRCVCDGDVGGCENRTLNGDVSPVLQAAAGGAEHAREVTRSRVGRSDVIRC